MFAGATARATVYIYMDSAGSSRDERALRRYIDVPTRIQHYVRRASQAVATLEFEV
jgi:hypothetical protein